MQRYMYWLGVDVKVLQKKLLIPLVKKVYSAITNYQNYLPENLAPP